MSINNNITPPSSIHFILKAQRQKVFTDLMGLYLLPWQHEGLPVQSQQKKKLLPVIEKNDWRWRDRVLISNIVIPDETSFFFFTTKSTIYVWCLRQRVCVFIYCSIWYILRHSDDEQRHFWKDSFWNIKLTLSYKFYCSMLHHNTVCCYAMLFLRISCKNNYLQ